MDKKSKILNWIFFGTVLLSMGFSFLRYVILGDYVVSADASCNPRVQSCFMRDCEEEIDGAGCDTLTGAQTLYYYKIIERNYRNIDCEGGDPRCAEPLPCEDGEAACEEILCEGDGCSAAVE